MSNETEIIKYLQDRVAYLKEADLKLCNDRWDMNKSVLERLIARETSNEVTARRHELEEALKFINSPTTIKTI